MGTCFEPMFLSLYADYRTHLILYVYFVFVVVRNTCPHCPIFLSLLQVSQWWTSRGEPSSSYSLYPEQGTPRSSQTSPASPGLQQAGIDWHCIHLLLSLFMQRLLTAGIIQSVDVADPEIATYVVVDEI